MNSPVVWIIFPFATGLALLTLVHRRHTLYVVAVVLAAWMAAITFFIPINQPVDLGPISFKIDTTLSVLGRKLILTSDDRTMLKLLYSILLFWLVGGIAAKSTPLLPPVAFLVTALLTASLAVEPFLYAAILISAAVLVSIPLFPIPAGKKNPGVVRYLTFQMIGFPFLLLTGWFLGGLQTGAADTQDVLLAIVLLGLGFGFTLAIFPLYSWIPMMAEEEDPFTAGFIFTLMPIAILFSLLAYLNQYAWLRESVDLPRILQAAGILMIVTGGIWSAFQKDMGRMFGYAVIEENGFAVLSLGLMTPSGYRLFANSFLSRVIALGLWALCLSLLKKNAGSLQLDRVAGLGRKYPLLAIGILIAQFSIGGMPLLAGFPIRTAIVEELAAQSPDFAWVTLLGIAGIWTSGILSLYTLSKGDTPRERFWLHHRLANVLILAGVVALFFLGIFPHLLVPELDNLLLPYLHLLG